METRKITNFLLFAGISPKKLLFTDRHDTQQQEQNGWNDREGGRILGSLWERMFYVVLVMCLLLSLHSDIRSALVEGMTKLFLTMTNILKNVIMKSLFLAPLR